MIQNIPLEYRFQPDGFDAHELEVISGALNRYGVDNLVRASPNNLSVFTWEQVKHALMLSRKDCIGDALDDLDDVLWNVRHEEREYAN